eukprot:CAMPEP_0170602728 /NCGR_PEP_ID=MMETSP0224-20130122/18543_1 /TAXON_ID=285029 /ORGANISM="Togula jolla, Strain CCCM 725" /LENGTH=318 /DNA_ID=CAMNT_0010927581 /DNA_START=67 /DNA_END=1020 /DNA_ORIENTATION=+
MPRRRSCRSGAVKEGTEGQAKCADRGPWGEMFKKTKMCKSFLSGKCTRGEACSFAHVQEELQPLPDLRHTKVCRAFHLTGSCVKGDSCNFIHSNEDMERSSSSAMQQRTMGQRSPTPQDGEMGCLPGSLSVPHVREDSLDLDLSLSLSSSLHLREASAEAAEAEGQAAKTAKATKEMWSCLATALATAPATSSCRSCESWAPAHEHEQTASSGSPKLHMARLRLPHWLPESRDRDLTRGASQELDHAFDFAESAVSKKATDSEDIFSRQTTAQATSIGWSRQTTTQDEEARDVFSRQTSNGFELKASCIFKLQGLPMW